MGQFTFAVDSNAINKELVQSFIANYYGISGSSEFLNLKNMGYSGKIYVTDNFSSKLFSDTNKKSIVEAGDSLNGYSQYLGTPAILINFNAEKDAINILVHEIGHAKWPGLGIDKTQHDPLFYRLLNDSLTELGIPVDAVMDLRGIDITNVPSPVPDGKSPLGYNLPRRRSDAGGDEDSADLPASDPTQLAWETTTSPDGKTVTATATATACARAGRSATRRRVRGRIPVVRPARQLEPKTGATGRRRRTLMLQSGGGGDPVPAGPDS